ncbi:MAG: valine--tRNA ligase [Hyphomicrobium sp.]|nr:valine--tRNA ligase [Hyphomicrobium sp.]
MLDKTYQPAEIEPRIHAEWEGADAFKCGRPEHKDAEPFCIVIPPPNVTGSLHMGHALNNMLQDVLCRFERMRGKDVLWQPGTDHAGIATQMVVERQMMERQEPNRQTIGRERFVEKIWAWKEESGNTIFNQLKRLGVSCDWSRERFTMDEGLSQAVVKVFVELYNAGLIYKDKRLVNWDPKFQTAISDLEVIQVETKGHLWHFKYPLKGDPEKFIVVATTRPETMLGDTAVAVHPDDERYKDLVGKTVLLPLVEREIPIVADEYSDPEKGSGAVKITPAHDFNDFEVGKRHDLAQINIFDEHARINENAPEAYCGLDRFEARKRIVADIDALGLLDKIEDNVHAVPHGDRSHVAIEPFLTDQWYVDAKTLAAPAIKAIEDGKTVFVPKAWEKTYFEWMRNIQPWCISRQLWWGHQIPIWYGLRTYPDPASSGLHTVPFELQEFCAETEAEATEQAREYYGKEVHVVSEPPVFSRQSDNSRSKYDVHGPTGPAEIWRDEDVLDTWFSSGLWAFSTLGWPDETPELKRYYPTSVLVTGFDIIFFWIARMMMLGLHFMKEVPFHTVYIHALVRDASGQKMSKSKGNVMDPLGVIDTYGADALRFTLAAMAAQGRDLKLSTARVEGYRNFATKLWNASRFAEMNECVRQRDFDPANVKEPLNRWIAGQTERATRSVTKGLESYKFNEAAGAVYEFVWGIFCDWYLELIKPILAGDDETSKAETRATVAWVLDQILKLLHPFMPFITEELWAHMVEHGEKRRSLLTLSEWPSVTGLSDEKVDDEIGWVVRLIGEIRSVRTEMNVPAAAKVPLALPGATVALRERARRHEETISRLARLESLSFPKVPPKGAALIVVGETTAALSLAGVIDMGAEMKRLEREIGKAESDLGKMDTKLANPQFLAKAKEAAVEETRERKVELEGTIKRLAAAVTRLQAIG